MLFFKETKIQEIIQVIVFIQSCFVPLLQGIQNYGFHGFQQKIINSLDTAFYLITIDKYCNYMIV